jgi:hypothetical protein
LYNDSKARKDTAIPLDVRHERALKTVVLDVDPNADTTNPSN